MNEDLKMKVWRYAPALLIVLSAFLLVETVNSIKSYRYIGGGRVPDSVISVSGEGEVFAIPDIANVSFSLSYIEKDVQTAQRKVTEQMNKILAAVKNLGIEDRDVKTISYNAYPKYDYNQPVCLSYPCPPGSSELVGYEVSHTIELKIRKVDDSGKILSALGEFGVTNLSGINYTVDDEEKYKREARQKAIDQAREKAKELAKDLSVRLVRVVSFSESGGPYPILYRAEAALVKDGGAVAPTPQVPTGENRISSSVTITYEIR